VLVRADGTSERLPSTGLPLGAGWGNSWDEGTVRMRPGDALVSVSDGVLDAFDGTLESLDAVEALVRGAGDSAGIVRAISDAVAGQAPDDVSVLALRRVETPRLEAL
jgi:serine phosphatase RsbU (regulator of sigma subunit)